VAIVDLAEVRQDARSIRAFLDDYETSASIEAVEARIPDHVDSTDAPTVGVLIDTLTSQLESAGLESCALSLESSGRSSWPRLVTILERFRSRSFPGLGLKIRCGGPTAGAFPSPSEVGRAIAACRDAGIRLKCTAGLHHPVRRLDPSLDVMSHGFLNVLGAAVLAHARGLDLPAIEACVSEEEAGAFSFDDGLSWRGETATAAEVRAARLELATGFGSCSFEEPRDDLVALGLLGES
jgi:hypothetical protein